MDWSRKSNDISWMLLVSIRLSIVVQTMLSMTMVGNSPTLTLIQQSFISLDWEYLQAFNWHDIDEWIPPGGRVCCMLSLRLLDRSLCLTQVYGPNACALYPEFVRALSADLRRVKSNHGRIQGSDWGDRPPKT